MRAPCRAPRPWASPGPSVAASWRASLRARRVRECRCPSRAACRKGSRRSRRRSRRRHPPTLPSGLSRESPQSPQRGHCPLGRRAATAPRPGGEMSPSGPADRRAGRPTTIAGCSDHPHRRRLSARALGSMAAWRRATRARGATRAPTSSSPPVCSAATGTQRSAVRALQGNPPWNRHCLCLPPSSASSPLWCCECCCWRWRCRSCSKRPRARATTHPQDGLARCCYLLLTAESCYCPRPAPSSRPAPACETAAGPAAAMASAAAAWSRPPYISALVELWCDGTAAVAPCCSLQEAGRERDRQSGVRGEETVTELFQKLTLTSGASRRFLSEPAP